MVHDDPVQGLQVFERGWLSSNNVLVEPAPGEAGAWLFDTSHVNHEAQTLALVRQALAGRPLVGIANTHLHSDHAGGNAGLQRAFGAVLALPPGQAAAVQVWDEGELSYRATGQRMARFDHQQLLVPGECLVAGAREWEVIAAPGHDPHMVMLFDRARGVLVSADALWENGFGLIFPEIEGASGFAEQAASIEVIAGLPVRVVVPGHGRVFDDVSAALERARSRLRGFVDDPSKHTRHVLRVLLKYHLMEEGRQPLDAFLGWAEATPLLRTLWVRHAPVGVASPREWVLDALEGLARAGTLRREGEWVADAG